MEVTGAAAYSEGLETLRMEAGGIRVDADFGGKKHLLPETGLEHQAVSYSKGCYLGQEVIARVRTYGSVPRALRALCAPDGRRRHRPPPPTAGRAARGRNRRKVGPSLANALETTKSATTQHEQSKSEEAIDTTTYIPVK